MCAKVEMENYSHTPQNDIFTPYKHTLCKHCYYTLVHNMYNFVHVQVFTICLSPDVIQSTLHFTPGGSVLAFQVSNK